MGAEFVLAIDVGGGSLRAGLIRLDGRVEASAAIALAIAEPRPGRAEIDPSMWWHALIAAGGRVLRKLPRAGRVLGIGICGLTRSQVLLDARGRTLGPAILFRDRRAADVAREIAGESSSGNAADAITAFHPLARLAWVARHQPARFARTHVVLDPKDYLNHRLTGVIGGDTVTHSRERNGPHDASSILGRCEALLQTPLRAPWQQLGAVTLSARGLEGLSGVPVFAGSMDTWGSAVGSGAVRVGQAYDVAGTSEAVGLLVDRPVAVAGLVSLAWTEDAYQVGGPTQAGADSARWCHATFRVRGSVEQAIERAARTSPRHDRPHFLPYLAGERTPVWRSDVRAAFHGVDRAHPPDDFLWAVLEGVAMAGRDILEHASAGSAQRATELRVSGGGARSNAWCQMKADILGLPVLRSKEEETGMVGAAIAAAVGAGAYRDVGEAATAMVRVGRRFEPRRRLSALYDARAEQYRRIKQAALALADATTPTPDPK